MALTLGNDPFAASFTFQDNNGNVSQTGLYLPNSLSIAEVQSGVTLLRGPLLALTNATLLGANTTVAFLEDAPVAAPPESEVERKLVMVFRTTNRRQRARIEVPSPIFGLEQPGTDQVALDNPLVAAFATAVISGAFGAENGARTISGGDIVSLERAYIAHRTRRVTG